MKDGDDAIVDAPFRPIAIYPVVPFGTPWDNGTAAGVHGKLDFVLRWELMVLEEIRFNILRIASSPALWEKKVVGREKAMLDPCDLLPSGPAPRCAVK